MITIAFGVAFGIVLYQVLEMLMWIYMMNKAS